MSGFSEMKERLSRLNPKHRAMLTQRLAAGPDTSPSDVYHEMVPAVPLRKEVFGPLGENPRQTAIYPASHGQQRMWFLHEYSEHLPVYVTTSSFHLVGPFDEELLIGAVADVVRRHDTLRTAFVTEGEQLFQHVTLSGDFAFEAQNFQTVPEAEREATARRYLEEVASRSFDLAAAPGFRVVLARLGPEEHALCLVLHHIISDGWSRSNLWREVNACYTARSAGVGMPLPPLPVQFVDYAAWQLRQLAGGTFDKQAEYWKTQLADKLEPLYLPSDRPRPQKESFRGARTTLVLDADLTARLTMRAREEGATLFMILLAAYKTLLHRYTGSVDLLVGVPIANRPRVEVEALVGFFVNTLVMRTDLSGDPTFRELLGRVKETAVQAYANQDMPFDRLVEILQIPRHAGVTPVFQVSFALQDFPDVSLELPDIRATPWPVATHTAKFDLHLAVEKVGAEWVATAEYRTDLFDADRVERMLGHWRVILESIAHDPGQTLTNIPLLTEHERHQLLVDWNRTGREYPKDKCLQQLFEEQVQRSPDAVAVVCDSESLTYLELNTRANRVAGHLQSLGVGPDALVGLCVERSLGMIVALLGIVKAGGAYVPLDPKLPRDRLKLLLDDIKAPLILCQRTTHERLLACAGESYPAGKILLLEDFAVGLAGSDGSDPPCGNTPLNLAYVMYTSGTTGQPKGVMVTHRGIVRLVIQPDYVKLGPDDVLLQFAPLSFDASTFEIWGSLLNGAKLVISGNELLDFTELGKIITGHRVTTLWLTAALFHQMMEQQPAALVGVRQLLAGGDVLSPAIVRKYLEMPGHGRLINGYGPTENTTFTCCGVFNRAEQIVNSVPIGRPISGTSVYILDKQGEPVPVGFVGEIYAGGDGLARGYLNAHELTETRFVPDPFSLDSQARLYKTGDLARWRADGNIEFVGRADHQVKIRGYRIELGEIEHALRRCHGVSDVAVVASVTKSGDKMLLAYLVAATEEAPTSATLRAELAEMLPEYMIPNCCHLLDELPLGSNGKLDRKALEELDGVELTQGGEVVVAETELERRLVGIWQEVLGKDRIGTHDNFFELGGHSIQAAQLAIEIENLVGQTLPISALFESPTIASLARRLSDEQWAPAWSSLVPLQPMGFKPPLFVVHGVGGDVYGFLGLAKQFAPAQPVYGIQAVGLDGSEPRHTSVEEMAVRYIKEIRSFQPDGPYHLCGYSMGGLIAYEMARQLHYQGQTALLILLDTLPTAPIPLVFHAFNIISRMPGRFLIHFRRFWAIPMAKKANYFRGRLYALRNLILKNSAKPHLLKNIDPEGRTTEIKASESDYFVEVSRSYSLSFYSGSLDYFACEGSGFSWKLYWRFLTGGRVRFHRTPVKHAEILVPLNIPELAQAIETVLQRSDQSG